MNTINQLAVRETETRFEWAGEERIPGFSKEGIAENFPLKGPRSVYGATKLSAELILKEFNYSFDMPVMIAVSLACLPIFFTDHLIARWEGALFLGYYVAYTLYLILSASQHDSLPLYSNVMMAFVIPLTVVTLIVLTIRAWKQRR